MRVLVSCAVVAACGYAPERTGDVTSDASIGQLKKLTFDNSPSATDLVGFPVPITIDGTTIDHALVADPATDLRFEDPEDGDLPFEIERWDPAGISVVWVRVPRIDGGSTTDSILMHVGPSARGNADAEDVWTGYRVVTHLGSHLESSANDDEHAGTALGATVDPQGQVTDATRFANANDRVMFAGGDRLFDGWSAFSFEFWIRLDYASSDLGTEPRVFTKGPAVNLARLIEVNPNVRHQIDWAFTSGPTFRGTIIPLQTWTHIVWTFDGQFLRVYRDGMQRDVEDLGQSDRLVVDGGQFQLGNASNAFDGAFDELRIAETARSADEVLAAYRSMTGAFVTIADL